MKDGMIDIDFKKGFIEIRFYISISLILFVEMLWDFRSKEGFNCYVVRVLLEKFRVLYFFLI